LSFNWVSGAAQFTPDSTRVLVVEGSGRGRWFKLPSGELEREWQFDEQIPGLPPMVVKAMSWGGQRLVCYGTASSQPLTCFILDGRTGKLSSVLGQGFDPFIRVCLSGDGRLGVLNQKMNASAEQWMIVFDAIRGAELSRISVGAGVSPVIALSANGRKTAALIPMPGKDLVIYDLVISKKSG
ncbi:MAG TPA: hypothetical protein VG097_02520, partial [Gemmata sp.]|jgi:hypothetical protein|nr:hypothetical protein [Gemmata sp.]